MSDNKILVVPADLAQKIDDNRGDMSRVEFIEVLIDNLVTGQTDLPKLMKRWQSRLCHQNRASLL